MSGRDWILGLVLVALALPRLAVGAEPDPAEVRRLMEKYERDAARERPKVATPAAPKPHKTPTAPKVRKPPPAVRVQKPRPAPKPRATPAVDADREAWTAADACATLICIQGYLDDYPRGRYAKQARARARLAEAGLELKPRKAAAPVFYLADAPRQTDDYPVMVRIPSGSFLMGCQPGEKERADNEKPAHRVRVAAFALGEYEVTVAQFRAFVEANPGYRTEAERGQGCGAWKDGAWQWDQRRSWRNPGFGQGERSPVTCVSWNDTQDYMRWLNRQTGKQYRLPSEAEWEYAARAGTATAFSTGNCIKTSQANYDGNADDADCGARTGVYLAKTQPVGSYPANKWGLYDLHGNVWEWVRDCYHDSYAGAPHDGSAWLDSCYDSGLRGVRGGSWFHGPSGLRSADRGMFGTDNPSNYVGFRVARTLTL